MFSPTKKIFISFSKDFLTKEVRAAGLKPFRGSAFSHRRHSRPLPAPWHPLLEHLEDGGKDGSQLFRSRGEEMTTYRSGPGLLPTLQCLNVLTTEETSKGT